MNCSSNSDSLSNVLEVELSVKTTNESSEGDQKFGQGWVDVDVVLRLYVFRRELSEMDFVEASNSEDEATDGSSSMHTHTTLLGLESLNSLTPTARIHTPMSSFNSPEVMRTPPDGYGALRGGTCLRSSRAASRR